MTAAVEAREVAIAGERLLARADRTLWWPAARVLLVADVHFGKAASYRSLGVPVPAGTTAGTLERLDAAMRETGADKLVLLGDLWHSKSGRTGAALAAVGEWRCRHASVEVQLVLGNHDLRSGPLPDCLDVEEIAEATPLGPFCLCHHPCEHADGYVLAGHVHPAVSLDGRGRQSLTLPCFWFGESCGLLPAFGEFTGVSRISPAPADRVLAVAQGKVFEVRTSSASS